MRGVAAEVVRADVDIPKEAARRGVIRPDLLLVQERGLAGCARDDHGRLPVVLVRYCGRGWIVQSRHGDAHESMKYRIGEREFHRGAERCGQVPVIDALAVAPRELAIAAGDRPDSHRRVTEGDELVLEVPGKGVDGTGMALAQGGWVAVGVRPAAVGRLDPGASRIERKVISRQADPGGPIEAGT